MTPDEASALRDGASPGEWQWDETGSVAAVDGDGWEHVADYVYEDDAALIVAAPEMAAMIAGMREEWGVVIAREGSTPEQWQGQWYSTRETAEDIQRQISAYPGTPPTRIVRRYVTTPEEIS